MNLKLFITGLLLVFCIHTYSQPSSPGKTKRFHMEISTGLAIPSGLKEAGMDIGALLSIEPRYVLSSKFKLGLRMEAVLIYKNIRPSGEWFQSDNLDESGYLLTLDYMNKINDQTKSFWGVGACITDISSDDLDPLTPAVQYLQKTTYTCMIRGGFEFFVNRLRTGIEYNFVGPASFSRSNHYLSFKLGILLFTKKRAKNSNSIN